ncbi:hypothetical protein [Paraburkholderia sprentiae]|uniref:hypothetical protein n=1 Tax=Paraburkholderia sprentiae TaxID=948107 RepID=UPI001E376207|nr:hypothetical protein [Paraburkholderia sprentiae]
MNTPNARQITGMYSRWPEMIAATASARPISMATALELVIARTASAFSAVKHATSSRKPITEPTKRPPAISWLK